MGRRLELELLQLGLAGPDAWLADEKRTWRRVLPVAAMTGMNGTSLAEEKGGAVYISPRHEECQGEEWGRGEAVGIVRSRTTMMRYERSPRPWSLFSVEWGRRSASA